MSPRFKAWLLRARTCFRMAAAIDAALTTTQQACLDLKNEGTGWDALDAARLELVHAEQALCAARAHIRTALREHQPTAENREPEFWP